MDVSIRIGGLSTFAHHCVHGTWHMRYFMSSKHVTNKCPHEWRQLQLLSPPVYKSPDKVCCFLRYFTMSQLHIALKSVTSKHAFFYLTIISTKKSAHRIHIRRNKHTSFIEKDNIYLKRLEGKKLVFVSGHGT